MTEIMKVLLFISSYAPLYVMLLFEVFDFKQFHDMGKRQFYISAFEKNGFFMFGMGVLLAVSFWTMWYLSTRKGNTVLKCRQDSCVNQSGDVLNYFVTYLVPILSMDINDVSSVFINVFLFLIIGILYVKSEIVYLNPLMLLMGYRIFNISGNLIISKKNLFQIKEFIAEHGYVEAKHLCGDVYIEAPRK